MARLQCGTGRDQSCSRVVCSCRAWWVWRSRGDAARVAEIVLATSDCNSCCGSGSSLVAVESFAVGVTFSEGGGGELQSALEKVRCARREELDGGVGSSWERRFLLDVCVGSSWERRCRRVGGCRVYVGRLRGSRDAVSVRALLFGVGFYFRIRMIGVFG